MADIASDRLYQERRLLDLEGHLFELNSQHAEPIDRLEYEDVVSTPFGPSKTNTVISFDKSVGRPGGLAFRILQASIIKLTTNGFPKHGKIIFSAKELSRFVDRKNPGGKDLAEIRLAISQLQKTNVDIYYPATPDELQEQGIDITKIKDPDLYVSFKHFQMISSSAGTLKKIKSGDQLTRIELVFPEPVISAIQNNQYVLLDATIIRTLKPPAIALYKHLFERLSVRYGSLIKKEKHDSPFSYRKDYASICFAWLGGFKVFTQASKIKNQLKRHLDALIDIGLLAKWSVEANATKTGHNIIVYPGHRFFTDYHRFYGGQKQLFPLLPDDEIVAKCLSLFYGTNNHKATSKELEFLSDVIDLHEDKAPQFITYGLHKATETNFKVKNIVGLRQYLASFKPRPESPRKSVVNRTPDPSKLPDSESSYRAAVALLSPEEIESFHHQAISSLSKFMKTMYADDPNSPSVTASIKAQMVKLINGDSSDS